MHITNAIRVFILLLAGLLLGGADLAWAEMEDQARYDACMTKARQTPEQGLEDGLAWQSLGGGEAAGHCVAMALIGLQDYEEAARRLEALVQNSKSRLELRAALLSQAAQAWTLAGDSARAAGVLKSAQELTPLEPRPYFDRAVALADVKDYKAAVEDLTHALRIDPLWADAMVLRASAYRYLEDFAKARADLDKAFTLAPGHQEGLLERGMLNRLENRPNDARQDWLKAIAINPNTPAADTARANLQILDAQGKTPEK